MILNIAICDDDHQALIDHERYVTSYSLKKDIDIQIKTFTNAKDMLDTYEHGKRYDIIFLDIEMVGLSGIEAASTIRSRFDKKVSIIIISNYPQYMADSFSIHPFNYIIKPINAEKINNTLDEIISTILDNISYQTIILSDMNEIRINIKDIFYISTENAKKELLIFHMTDTTYITKGTITYWNKRLNNYGFYVCYKGILLNISHVHYLTSKRIILENNETIPVSRKYYKDINDIFFNKVIAIR